MFEWYLELSLLIIFLITASIIDLKSRIVPDTLTAIFFAAAIIIRFFYHDEHSLIYYLAGAAAGFVILLIVSLMTNEDIGGGDIKIYAPIGLILGVELTLLSLIVFSIVVIVYYLVRWMKGRLTNKRISAARGIPLVPFITVSVLIIEGMKYYDSLI